MRNASSLSDFFVACSFSTMPLQIRFILRVRRVISGGVSARRTLNGRLRLRPIRKRASDERTRHEKLHATNGRRLKRTATAEALVISQTCLANVWMFFRKVRKTQIERIPGIADLPQAGGRFAIPEAKSSESLPPKSRRLVRCRGRCGRCR